MYTLHMHMHMHMHMHVHIHAHRIYMTYQVLLSTDKSSEECDVDCLSYGAFVNSVAFSPDGNLLAGGGYANQVKVWDVSTLVEGGVGPFPVLFTLRHDGPVNSVCFHPKSVRTLHLSKG